MACPLCEKIDKGETVVTNESAAALWDAYPVSPGHALVVPRRHEANFLALAAQEQQDIWALVGKVRRRIEEEQSPQGYNIGINIGEAAGQTVGHAHLHIIPRYEGDVEDPRGGVRWVVPEKAKYWS